MSCNNIILLLLLVIVYLYYTRKQSDIGIIYVNPNIEFDERGVSIKGSGLTPLTTPPLKSNIQLKLSDCSETSIIQPDDL